MTTTTTVNVINESTTMTTMATAAADDNGHAGFWFLGISTCIYSTCNYIKLHCSCAASALCSHSIPLASFSYATFS
jgi:hypothetical protein